MLQSFDHFSLDCMTLSYNDAIYVEYTGRRQPSYATLLRKPCLNSSLFLRQLGSDDVYICYVFLRFSAFFRTTDNKGIGISKFVDKNYDVITCSLTPNSLLKN